MPKMAQVLGGVCFRLFEIVGNSMAPELLPGQRVMYDPADTRPSPPGIFIIYDGLAYVCHQLEFIPHSNPRMVRISSANPAFKTYDMPLDQLQVCGRVVESLRPT